MITSQDQVKARSRGHSGIAPPLSLPFLALSFCILSSEFFIGINNSRDKMNKSSSYHLLRQKPHRRDVVILSFRRTAGAILLTLLCQALLPVFAFPLRRHMIVEQKEDDLRSSQSTGTGTSAGGESRNSMMSATTASTRATATKEKEERHLYVSSTAKTKSSNSIVDDVRPTSRGHVQQLNFTGKNPWPGNNFTVYIGKPAWI